MLSDDELAAIEGHLTERAMGAIIPINRMESGEHVGSVQVAGDRVVDLFIEKRFRREEQATPEQQRETMRKRRGAAPGTTPEQAGLEGFAEEVGTRERRQRPGQELVDEFRETGEPPDRVDGWTYVPEDDRIGNRRHGGDAHAWETPDGHLRIRMRTPTTGPREAGKRWDVELKDDRIVGMGSAVSINTRKPDFNRAYDSVEEAIQAAIRWMAQHPADRAEHPFFDARIHDPPETWELSSHRLTRQEERIGFRLEDDERAPPDLLKSIHIDGFHQGDRYTIATGIRPDPGLADFDQGARFPGPDQEVPRGRMLDAATRFMERNPFVESFERFEESGDDAVADAGDGDDAITADVLENLAAQIRGRPGHDLQRDALFESVELLVEEFDPSNEVLDPAVSQLAELVFGPDHGVKPANVRRIARERVEESGDDTVADAGDGDDEGASEQVCDAFRDEILRALNTDDLERVDVGEVGRTLNTAADRGCIDESEAEGIANTLRGMEGARFPGPQLSTLSDRVLDAFRDEPGVDVFTVTETDGSVVMELQPGDAVEVEFYNTVAGRPDSFQGVIDRIGDFGAELRNKDIRFELEPGGDVRIDGRSRGHLDRGSFHNDIRKLFDS